MNKRLIFNEGGQPVFLDDLKTLQEHHFSLWKSMLGTMTMKAEAFLQEPVEKEYLGDDRIRIGGGTIIADGMLFPFEGKELDVSGEAAVYILIKRDAGDYRVFEDGQTRPCVETMTATLSTSIAGADRAYRLDRLETFLVLFAKALEAARTCENADVTFMNGYGGQVKIERDAGGTDAQLVIDIRSANTAWNPDALGYKGLLFSIKDEALAKPLWGKVSKKFVYEGKEYRLSVSAGPVSGFVSLELGNGRDNYYEEDYVLPLIPVRETFKLSEFTQF